MIRSCPVICQQSEMNKATKASYSSVYAECLVDVNADKIVESGLCAGDRGTRDRRLVHEAFHRIGICDFLIVAKGKPFFPHGCGPKLAAGCRVEMSMVSSQVSQAMMSKPVCPVSLRRLPSKSRDSKQRSCCNGVCEVHEIGGG